MSQNINLCDSSLRPRRDLLGAEAALAFTASAALVVALGGALAHWSLAKVQPLAAEGARTLKEQEDAQQKLSAKSAAVVPDTALQARVASAQRTLMQRRVALESLVGPGVDREGGFSLRLAALARQSIDGLWLTGMTLQRDNVLLKGRTMTPSLIPAYVQRLDHETSLQGHAFRALDVKRPLDTSARAAPVNPATAGETAEAPAGPVRAAFVDFTLVGNGSVETVSTEKETRP